ncbi:MAG TPA: hypothetical protein VLD62_10745 [Acidimicrobiia bacterium]|nr:hypothetical protein [Acidimicrobiia bacterium]
MTTPLAELTAPGGFRYSFGAGPDGDLEEPLMQILADTLNRSHAVVEIPDGPDLYVWPAAATGPWEELTDEPVAELETIHSPGEITGYEEFGAFIGWRAGITEAGEWQYLVAGD